MGNDKVLRSAEILTKYADRTAPPQYDIIYDLPYETLDDKLDTLRLVAELPKPYRLQAFSVIFYPGTSLHTLAMRDGLVQDEKDEIYDKMYFEKNDTYTNVLLYLAKSGRFPSSLLKVLIDKRVAEAATSDYARPFASMAKLGVGKLRALLRNPALERAKALGTFEARMTGMTGADAGAAAPTAAAK